MSRQRQRRQQTGRGPQTNVYPTAVDIPEGNRVQAIQLLNQALADTTDLQSQAKFAHWNVKGYDFYQLHLLFDELAETLSEHVDVLAERATVLGGQAMGTTRIAAETSRIPEPPVNAVGEAEYLGWLTDHVGYHANGLRRAIDHAAQLGDEDTADLFTELSREVDEQLYFLESHLQSEVRMQVPATAEEAGGPGTQTDVDQWVTGQEAGGRAATGQGPGGQQPARRTSTGQQSGSQHPAAGQQSASDEQSTTQQFTHQQPTAARHPAQQDYQQ
jgi:starvation-inducible DNA-binding protein